MSNNNHDLGPMPEGVANPRVNLQFVQTLENVLANAKAGKISGGALILCMADNALDARTVMCFPPMLAPMVIAGSEFLKEEIIGMVRQAQRGGGRSILRAQGQVVPRN